MTEPFPAIFLESRVTVDKRTECVSDLRLKLHEKFYRAKFEKRLRHSLRKLFTYQEVLASKHSSLHSIKNLVRKI